MTRLSTEIAPSAGHEAGGRGSINSAASCLSSEYLESLAGPWESKYALLDPFQCHHTLLKLNETPDDKEQVVGDSVCKSQGKTAHSCSHAWRNEDGNSCETHYDGRKEVEPG